MYRFTPHLMGVALAAALAACNDLPTRAVAPTAFRSVDEGGLASDVIGVWKDSVVGTASANAQYGLFMPRTWNGDVVYYAHGFVAPQLPVGLPSEDIAPLRDALGSMGYAVAYSSFSENGYDFADGVRRTHQLRGLFTSTFGKANRALLVGHSLGGQIVQALAEEHGAQYDGALSLCGVVGGTAMETQYIGQIRTVFDFFYSGVLPGSTLQMPAITDVNAQIVGPAYGAIAADGFQGFGAMTQLDQTPLAGRNFPEKLTTLLRVLALHSLEANDLLGRTHGHTLFDNAGTAYSSATLPGPVTGALNAYVTRYTATPDASQWLAHNYQPTGKLAIPMVTLHKRYDWLVPFAQEAAYRTIVANAGNSGKLRQRTADEYGHCDFSGAATLGSFLELVSWVKTGIAPAP